MSSDSVNERTIGYVLVKASSREQYKFVESAKCLIESEAPTVFPTLGRLLVAMHRIRSDCRTCQERLRTSTVERVVEVTATHEVMTTVETITIERRASL